MSSRMIFIFSVCSFMVFGLISFAASSAEQTYKLGPQDRIEIKVNDVRTGSAEVHKWDAFDGDFIVGSSGSLFLPLVGEIDVNNLTVSQVAKIIEQRIQSRVGLTQPPVCAIQITKYRPFYIMGAVEKPGEYDFRPGLTVLQAMSTAGGIARSQYGDNLSVLKDVISREGEVSTLDIERLSLAIKKLRLESEASSSAEMIIPKDISSIKSNTVVAGLISTEQALFHSRLQSMRSKLDSIDRARSSINSELTTLSSKYESISKQLALAKDDLSQVQNMIGRGLTVNTRQLSAEQTAASYQNSQLDVQLNILKARQELSRLERERVEISSKYREDALQEIATIDSQISTNAEKVETAKRLLNNAGYPRGAPTLSELSTPKIQYILTHKEGDEILTANVDENVVLSPGDVLRVNVNYHSGTTRAEAQGAISPGDSTSYLNGKNR